MKYVHSLRSTPLTEKVTNYYMNGLIGVQWGVFTLGGCNGKLLHEWVVWNPMGVFHTGGGNSNGKTVVTVPFPTISSNVMYVKAC